MTEVRTRREKFEDYIPRVLAQAVEARQGEEPDGTGAHASTKERSEDRAVWQDGRQKEAQVVKGRGDYQPDVEAADADEGHRRNNGDFATGGFSN